MPLVKLFFLLFAGVCIIIKPDLVVSTRVRRPTNAIYQQPYYDKSTMRLWRGLGIGITIIAIFFLLKKFEVL
jgi:hypothetical protein